MLMLLTSTVASGFFTGFRGMKVRDTGCSSSVSAAAASPSGLVSGFITGAVALKVGLAGALASGLPEGHGASPHACRGYLSDDFSGTGKFPRQSP